MWIPIARPQGNVPVALSKRQGGRARKKKAKAVVEAPPVIPSDLASQDYTDAHNYITDFYNFHAEIAEDIWDAAGDAVDSFFLTATMPRDNLRYNIVYQVVRIALGVLPATSVVKELFDKLEDVADVTKQLVFVTAQRTASGVYTQALAPTAAIHKAARDAKDSCTKLSLLAKDVVLEELDRQRTGLQTFAATHPDMRGFFRSHIIQVLGAKPAYDPLEILAFQREFEIQLYKKAFASKAYIQETRLTNYDHAWESVEGIPDPVLARLVELTGAASDTAAVLGWNLRRKVVKEKWSPL